MHILSAETDNCPSWISRRERMTVKIISRSISTKECCRPRRGLNPRPPGLQSDGASNWATEAGKIINSTPILFSLIILVTFHTIFASSFYFAQFQYFHDISWNTLDLEMAVWSKDLPSPLMAIFIFTSGYALISCPLCMSNTPCNIFMIHGGNVEQDEMTCHV